MKKFRISIIFTTILCFGAAVHAGVTPDSVAKTCTTTEEIYNSTTIHTNDNIQKEQKREAILKALGHSTSNPNFAVQNFKGQWFYEHETDDAVFAGYKIRSHYLKVAVIYSDLGLDTILCDSLNLRQSEDSIHRKAPLWKQTLDTRIRVEMANISTKEVPGSKEISSDIKMLDSLYSKGFLTKIEYEVIKERIEKK